MCLGGDNRMAMSAGRRRGDSGMRLVGSKRVSCGVRRVPVSTSSGVSVA